MSRLVQPKRGDRIRVIMEGPLNGLEGTVRNVRPDHSITAVFAPTELAKLKKRSQTPMYVKPEDGYGRYWLLRGEYEIMGRGIIFA